MVCNSNGSLSRAFWEYPLKLNIIFSVAAALVMVFATSACGSKNASVPDAPQYEAENPGAEQILSKQDNATLLKVNGEAVPRWMFNNAYRDTLLSKGFDVETISKAEERQVQYDILENLIAMEALEQESIRKGTDMNIRGGQLRALIVKGGYGDPEKFKRVLAQAGMTEDQYAELWKQQASVNQLVERVILKDVGVSDEELRARYERDKGKYLSKDGAPASFEEVKDNIIAAELEDKRRQVFEAYKNRMIDEAEIDILERPLRKIWMEGREERSGS
jgi:peptidyl-prolyl cis-trans isomerase C